MILKKLKEQYPYLEEVERKAIEYDRMQEGVEPKEVGYMEWPHGTHRTGKCGQCDNTVYSNDTRCRICGYKIKWGEK